MQRNKQAATLILRLLLGLIFFFQGFGKIFNFGLDAVYKNFFLTTYQDLLPEVLILGTAYYTSYIEFIAGFLLIIGLKRDFALYALASVLVIVTFGYGLAEPIWDLSHVLFRTLLLVSLLLLPKDWDVFSIDNLISKKSRLTTHVETNNI